VLVAMMACPGEQSGAPLAAEPVGMGFDRDIHGWWPGSAIGALVLMPYARALREGRRVYAVLLGMSAAAGRAAVPSAVGGLTPPALEDVRACCRAALAQAETAPAEIGYLEMFACGQDGVDGAEIAGVCQTYRPVNADLSCAFGSVQSNLGFLGGAAGLFGLLRAALCLSERMLPVVPGWNAPKLPALWRNSPFYAPAQSSAWFVRQDGRGRLAALNVIGLEGSFAHLILGEAAGTTVSGEPASSSHALRRGGFLLFPLSADDLPGLLQRLAELRSALAYAPDLFALAAEWHAAEQPGQPYGLAIVGHTPEELLREVDLAVKALPSAFEKQGEWQTPLGSCFSGSPVGATGQVAFVYPGAFNSYPWVGKDLFRLFPWLHQRSLARTLDVGNVLRERELYPRSLAAPSKEEQAAQEARLLNSPVAMLTSGSSLAILFAYILKEGFNIQPAAAFGYSLGENSMLFASQVWQEGDAAAAALQASPLFHNRLAGPQNAIRAAWGLPQVDSTSETTLWSNYLVMAPVDTVRAQVELEPRVYITHINTPRQVVIGGDPDACQRILAALRSPSIKAPFDYALHCAAIASEKGALVELHDLPLENVPTTHLYTAASYQPMQFEPLAEMHGVIAEQVARMLCSPLDFPRLVRQVYADGARVFIEVGAGGNCARWVSESLKGEAHLALSVNRRGTDDYHTLVRLLAKLHSHRVPMDLSKLYQPLELADKTGIL
jgi:PfaB family protein